MLLGEMITRGKERYPDKIALCYKDRTWTYTELEDQTNQAARGLQGLGIKKGDRVGLLHMNSPYFIISYFAIVKLGAVVVPINVMFKGEEITFLMNNAQAAAMIVGANFEPLIKAIRPGLSTVKNIVLVDTDAPAEDPGYVSFAKMLAGVTAVPQTEPIAEDDVAVFLYTSGTTGHPKGAMLTHRNLVSNAAATAEATDTTEKDNTLCVLPMFHSFAWTCCVLLQLYTCGTVTIMESFVPQTVLNTIIKRKTTIIAAVPTMYAVMLQVPEVNPADFVHIRLAYSGGASLPVQILNRIAGKYGIKIAEGYGLSECSPVCTINPYKGVRKPGSIGVAIPGVELKIVDDNGAELPRGEAGELIVKGPNVMKGYFNLPEATAETLKNGWCYTGDVAHMDGEGYVFIVDRKKDLILVGGLNVYPREIEEILYTHPMVAEAAVIGTPDELRGEAVKAVIALKAGETATEREIIKFCQEKLANYKLPKIVEFVEALPKTSTGKILKRALK